MKHIFVVALLILAPLTAEAQDAAATALASTPDEGDFAPMPAEGADLDTFVWKNRVVVVFADSDEDPAFAEQMRYFADRWPEMAERDVVVITDTDPAAKSAIRQKLRPRGFMLVLIGKDGEIVLRKPFPWDVRELTRSIDKLPLRQEELRVRRFRAE